MNDRHPSAEPLSQATISSQPATSAGAETQSASGTGSGAVRVYDRPESVPRSWSPMTMVLLVIALLLILLAVYFFML